jgi:hypothetical protein
MLELKLVLQGNRNILHRFTTTTSSNTTRSSSNSNTNVAWGAAKVEGGRPLPSR